MITIRVITMVGLLLSCLFLHAEPTTIIQANLTKPVSPSFATLPEKTQDKVSVMNWQEALSAFRAGNFSENYQTPFVGRELNTRYWFAMNLQGSVDAHQQDHYLYLKSFPASLVKFHIWILDDNGNRISDSVRDWNALSERRDVDQLPFGFAIRFNKPAEKITVIGFAENMNTGGIPVMLDFKLANAEDYREISQQFNILLIIFYSLMAALFFYNVFLLVSIREVNYLFYLFVMIAGLLVSSITDGTLLLPPDFLPKQNINYSLGIVSCFIYAGFIYFSLDRIRFWPAFETIMKCLLVVAALLLICNLSFSSNLFLFLSDIFIFVTFMVSYVALIKAWRNNNWQAMYFIGAESIFIFGTVAFNLQLNGLISNNFFTFYGLHLALFGEALLLSFALAARTKTAIQKELQARNDALVNQERALEAFQMATKAKNEFIANVSHELRTPLTSVIGFSEMIIEKHMANTEGEKYVQRILAAAKDLEKTIDDILNISLIYSHKIKVENVICDIDSLVMKLGKKFSHKAQQKGIQFTMEIEPDHEQFVSVDPNLLQQILYQLLDNAVKFTTEGKVGLHFALDIERKLMCFTITDTGCGIREQKLEFLLEPFNREDTSDSRLQSGTGVGMFLAKNLTEFLGGKFHVESFVNVGTVCRVVLAYLPSDASLAKQEDDEKTEVIPALKGNVLYAEDNVDNQDLVKILVEATGAKLTIANNGKEAVDELLDEKNKDKYQLVLMDIQMPIMDGVQALKIIKDKKLPVPVVAFSASAIANNSGYLAAGFDDFLTKPVVHAHLYQCLSEYLPAVNAESVAQNGSKKTNDNNQWDFSARKEFLLDASLAPLIRKFETSLPAKRDVLISCFNNKSWLELANQLHQLKGSAGSYGHEGLTVLCREAELHLKSEDYAECGLALNAITDYIEKVTSL